MIAEGVPLFAAYGATEISNPTMGWDELPRAEIIGNPEWAWFRFSQIVKVTWDPQGDGTSELIVHVRSTANISMDKFALSHIGLRAIQGARIQRPWDVRLRNWGPVRTASERSYDVADVCSYSGLGIR